MTATSKLTAATIDGIVAAMKQVPFVEVAAETVGVTGRTVRNWMRQGQQDDDAERDTPAAHLFRGVTAARATFERNLSTVVARQAFQGDWKAAAWVLSRMAPERWTEPQRLVLGGGKRQEEAGQEEKETSTQEFYRVIRSAYAERQERLKQAKQVVAPQVSAANGSSPEPPTAAPPAATMPAPAIPPSQEPANASPGTRLAAMRRSVPRADPLGLRHGGRTGPLLL